ncbi:MAG TPA: hypothetical protein VLG92_05905 [Candidatus Saccharimonadia bacterium]|nr:hypothetical protein [Candidatus Saccharimonadia bacterium]
MHENSPQYTDPYQYNELGGPLANPDGHDPNVAAGPLHPWVPPNEGQPLVKHVSAISSAEAPQWPTEYLTPISYPVPAEGSAQGEPERVHPQPPRPNLMDGKDHGAFVAPVAPVESEAEAHHSFSQVAPTPQRLWSVEELAKRRGLEDFSPGTNTHKTLVEQTRGINGARRRGIHLS